MLIPPRLRPWGRYGLHLLVVAACYYGGARLGLLQALVDDQVTPLWPPTGVALLALLLGGVRLWPGIAIAAFVVNATLGDSSSAFLISVGNTLGPVVAFLLLKHSGFRMEMDRTRDALALVFLGAFAGMAVSASIGTGALLFAGTIDSAGFWSTWSVWWTGDAMGVLILVPLVLAVRGARFPFRSARTAELAALLVCTTGVMLIAASSPLRLLYVVFPFAVWGALRFQHLGAAPCALIATALAARGAAAGIGPFAAMDLLPRMVTLQAFNTTVALTTLVLSAVIAERNEARRAIEQTCTQLAAVVEQYRPLLGDEAPPSRPDVR
ncbi:integral membrane sensor domain MASE1 [Saccharothrix tamanrassetensis]|uniref:Integral membrane sensor domain MASE1 n=1 Tax=Saccharothrix tamanrassetensis TaxID=1051531 RepID=A0A841CSJ9_9PSEU|nr:MASE1 domain-containing protein [Saccharothrix tamanrassetensis]MBB5959017.1 integral membrane sensor domain MASE1 [Saccharothrix tamanrassetensis]